MDPDVTLRLFYQAARNKKYDQYESAFRDLSDWLWNGGFLPAVPDNWDETRWGSYYLVQEGGPDVWRFGRTGGRSWLLPARKP